MCFLSRRVFFPATVVTPACSPVRIQGPEPRDEEDLLPVLILLIFPDTAALSCLIVHLLLSCLPCPCHVSVYQLEYSSSSPPPYTDCYNHTHLLYLLPLWRHLTVLFFFKCLITSIQFYSSYLMLIIISHSQFCSSIQHILICLAFVTSTLSIRSVLPLQHFYFYV